MFTAGFNAIYEGVTKSFRTESIMIYTLTFSITRWEATQRVEAAKLTRLSHKIVVKLHLVAERCTICSSRSRRPVRKFWLYPRIHSDHLQVNILKPSDARFEVFTAVKVKFRGLLRCVVWWLDTSADLSPEGGQYGPTKLWYPTTLLHWATTRKTTNSRAIRTRFGNLEYNFTFLFLTTHEVSVLLLVHRSIIGRLFNDTTNLFSACVLMGRRFCNWNWARSERGIKIV
jgi:hypothetical protein